MNNETIKIHRIVPGIYSNNLKESKRFYIDFLGMELAMDMGWILTFASHKNSTVQVNIFKNEQTKPLDNTSIFLSIEVSDVDKMYSLASEMGYKITYEITNENWGVRRFFVKDPNGVTVNLLMHI